MYFSVLMAVYEKETPEYLEMALSSIESQTLLASEVIIVKDGLLPPSLDLVIDSFSSRLPLKVIALENNIGLGAALNEGLKYCQYDVVARMDSDDICMPNRFELQITELRNRPELDVLGGAILEFEADPQHVISERRLPRGPNKLVCFSRLRNPLNHMTVFFRKAAVNDAGGYRDRPGFEDYDLWVRIMVSGGQIDNLDEVLVYARIGNGMHSRRTGMRYFIRELRQYFTFYRLGWIGVFQFLRCILLRGGVRMLPSRCVAFLYRKYLRL